MKLRLSNDLVGSILGLRPWFDPQLGLKTLALAMTTILNKGCLPRKDPDSSPWEIVK